MQALRQRKYELFVEYVDDELQQAAKVFVQAGEAILPFEGLSPTQVQDVLSPSSRTVRISDLNIKCSIDFSKEKKGTTNYIEIINASKETIDRIAKKNNKVLLRAGYSDSDLSTVFVGQVIYAETKLHGTDRVTTLVIKDGYTIKNSARITRSWPPKTSYGTIIQDLVKEMTKSGYSEGHLVLNVETGWGKIAPQFDLAIGGFTCEGYIDDILKELTTQMFGLEYYIFNNKIFITPFEYLPTRKLQVEENQIKTITSSTSARNMQPTEGGKKVFTLSTFLIGEIDVSDIVWITSGDYTGQYKIISIKHELDYLGTAWDTILEIETL